MTAYADSSALVAVYVTEPFSAEARRRVSAVPQLPFTPLHDLEVRNAFQLLRGRRLITSRELAAVTGHLEDDLQANRLLWTPVDFSQAFARGRQLSESYGARLLCRTLDILHVSAAQALGCSRFISGDDRQLRLARALRLAAIDIKRPRSRGRLPSRG